MENNVYLFEAFNCKHRQLDYCYLKHSVDICPCYEYEETLQCKKDCIHYDKKCGNLKCSSRDKACKRYRFNPDVKTITLPDRYEVNT